MIYVHVFVDRFFFLPLFCSFVVTEQRKVELPSLESCIQSDIHVSWKCIEFIQKGEYGENDFL